MPCGVQPAASLSLDLGPSEQAVRFINSGRRLSARQRGGAYRQGPLRLMSGSFLSPAPSRSCSQAMHSRTPWSWGRASSAGLMLALPHQAG